MVSNEWAGPLPPPARLAEFNDVIENDAERIMQQWEVETAHRHKLERSEIWIYGSSALFGRIFAFLFVLAALGVTAYAISQKAEWVAVILGGGLIGSVVWAFLHAGGSSKPPAKRG